MSDENEDNNNREQERDDKGRFSQKTQTDNNGQTSPTEGEYSKMNTILQKQTGMSAEKFVEYQRKFTPRELFYQLSFLADNQTTKPSAKKQTLPPNADFVPTSPGSEKFNLPGKAVGTQQMGKEGKFSIHRSFDARELFTPKKKE